MKDAQVLPERFSSRTETEFEAARHGKPVAELVLAPNTGLALSVAHQNRIAPAGDAWWQPMNGEEADDWIAAGESFPIWRCSAHQPVGH